MSKFVVPRLLDMDLVTGIVLLSLVVPCVAFTLLYIRTKQKYVQFPSAKPRWPLVGNALDLDMSRCHIILSEWAEKLGPAFRINMYGEEILVLNDFESIHSALVTSGSHFAGRPSMYRTEHSQRNKNSIVWQTYTPKLILMRKEVLKSLKMYGNGLDKLEEKCIPEIVDMLEQMTLTKGQPFDPWDMLYNAVCNVMLVLVLGIRLPYTDPGFHQLREINKLFNVTFGSGSGRLLDFIPWVRYFHNDEYERLIKALKMRDAFWEQQVTKRKKPVNEETVVGRLFRLVETNTSPEMDITEITVKESFTNLILAGTDTTATALACLLLIIIHRPDIQKRIHTEIDEHIGQSRLPTLIDRAHMPFLEATLLELLRYISHVPLAVPHSTICDTEILGRSVPANTTVYINLFAMHHDSKYWKDPWKFDPTRFLDTKNQLLPPQHEIRRRLMAFGAGRRVCLGEALAKNRLFLFATALLQRFQFAPGDTELPEMDPRGYSLGLVLHPKPYKLCARSRS